MSQWADMLHGSKNSIGLNTESNNYTRCTSPTALGWVTITFVTKSLCVGIKHGTGKMQSINYNS